VKQLTPASGRLAAASDTRFDKPVILTGSAAKGIARRLRGRGYRLVVEPKCFLVTTQNLLLEGELEQAAAWEHETRRTCEGLRHGPDRIGALAP
jgi:hypothetical protein